MVHRETRITRRNSCASATSSTTNPSSTGQGKNPELHGGRLAAICLSQVNSPPPKKKNKVINIVITYWINSNHLFININQLDALNFYNTCISSLYLFRAHVLIVRRAKLYYTVSGISPLSICARDGHL